MRVLAVTEAADAGRFASFDVPFGVWLGLLALIATLLIIDLLLVHRTAHVITFKEAAIESAVWIALGLAFTFVMLAWQGSQAAGEYLTGYVIEKSLSIDNVFIWAVIFNYFAVPREVPVPRAVLGHLRRAGAPRRRSSSPASRSRDVQLDAVHLRRVPAVHAPSGSSDTTRPRSTRSTIPCSSWCAVSIPSTTEYDGQKMFTRRTGRLLATPFFAVLILIETTDIVFAVDSIPAILAVTREQFIVFASNAFAILGLRALYFCLAGMADRFRYLNLGWGDPRVRRDEDADHRPVPRALVGEPRCDHGNIGRDYRGIVARRSSRRATSETRHFRPVTFLPSLS